MSLRTFLHSALVALPVAALPTASFADDPDCPDFSVEGGVELSDSEFAEYSKNPDVIRFPLSDAFICYKLKLYTRPMGPNNECEMGGTSRMPADALAPGLSYVQLQVSNHRSRCEYVDQVGPMPSIVRPHKGP
jgi:hypothetical protein